MYDMHWYILDDDNNVVQATLEENIAWYKKDPSRKIIGKTTVGDIRVSTIFLPLNHGWDGGTPLVFETMTFGENQAPEDQIQERYHTYDEAVAGHNRIVQELKAKQEKSDV